MTNPLFRFPCLVSGLLVCSTALLAAQDAAPAMAERYARARRLLSWNVDTLVYRSGVRPVWCGTGERFWYRVSTAEGSRTQVVESRTGARAVHAGAPPCSEPEASAPAMRSPDGRLEAYVSAEGNLLVRPTAGGEAIQLTADTSREVHYAIPPWEASWAAGEYIKARRARAGEPGVLTAPFRFSMQLQ